MYLKLIVDVASKTYRMIGEVKEVEFERPNKAFVTFFDDETKTYELTNPAYVIGDDGRTIDQFKP